MLEMFAAVSPAEARELLQDLLTQELLVQFLGELLSDEVLTLGLAKWSERYLRSSLESFNIEPDIQRLVGLGIRREVIAIAMIAINRSRHIDAAFGELGEGRERQRRAKMLLEPLPILQQMATMFGNIPDDVPGANFPNPARIIADLRLLSSMFSWGEWLHDFFGANSFFELSRSALAGLVSEKTGHFLDRVVSNLTGAALQDYEYDETRHRVWRITNRDRLQENTKIAVRLLSAINEVIPQPEKDSNT